MRSLYDTKKLCIDLDLSVTHKDDKKNTKLLLNTEAYVGVMRVYMLQTKVLINPIVKFPSHFFYRGKLVN